MVKNKEGSIDPPKRLSPTTFSSERKGKSKKLSSSEVVAS